MKIITVVGARPQFIKSGPVSRALVSAGIEERLVHTGQHYDLNMSEVFFETLGLREPQHYLGVGSGNHGAQTGAMLQAIEEVLVGHQGDALLVYGDTNSTLAGALAASKLHVPVVHVEAGLRSFNRQMPEEVNRVLTDHLSDLLFCPTSVAVSNLAREGIRHGVFMVGDVMKDALDYWNLQRPRQTELLKSLGLDPGAYFLATVHRAENVDTPGHLKAIIDAFSRLDQLVLLPLHPRTRQAILDHRLELPSNVLTIDPVGYLEMLELESSAVALLTDSGGVQKEAYMLGVPCITLREETEWVETVDTGWNTLVGSDTGKIVEAVRSINNSRPRPDLYGDGRASERIALEIQDYLSRWDA